MVESAVLRSVIFLSSTDVRNDAKDGNTRTKEGVKMVLISQESKLSLVEYSLEG